MGNKQFVSRQISLAQLSAVLIWLMISVIQWSNNPKNSPGIWLPLIVRGVEAFSILVTSFILVFFTYRILSRYKLFIQVFSLLPFIYFLCLLTNVISLSIRKLIGFAPPKIDGYFFIQSLHFYIPLTLILVFVEIIRYKKVIQIEREHKLQTEKLFHQSQWMMLRYQLNPHFLFNALNSVRALIGTDDNKARKIVTEMAEYFRYTLSVKEKFTVAINTELKAVMSYLEIQKIRFQDNLVIQTDIDPQTEQYAVPVFSIQTLVENAVKYGYRTTEGKLIVRIATRVTNKDLIVSVVNSGSLVSNNHVEESKSGTNTGLANLKNRLYYFDKSYSFNLFENNGMVIAEMHLRKTLEQDETMENNNH